MEYSPESMTSRSRVHLFCSLIAPCLLVVAGCGQDTGGKIGIEGNVTMDRQPLATGTISFRPLEPGKSSGGTIKSGAYSLPAMKGLMPGKYRVVIRALRDTNETYFNDESGEDEVVREQYIPEKYNTNTELTIELTADGPSNFDFNLSSEN